MNEAHLHLLFNHLPIIIPIVGLLVLFVNIIVRSEIVQRVGYLILILGAIATIPAFFTGEGAEEIVENIEGITHNVIHEHEEIAETFAILSYILGGLSLVGIWANLKRKSFSIWLGYAIFAYGLVVLVFAQQTGTTGGEIRHTEIRNGYLIPQEKDEDEAH
jgi:uncharacterized membrane protein